MITEPFEWKGFFHVPDSSKELPGILRFTDAIGLELDLFGNLEMYQSPSSRENNIILGTTEHGKKITLINCYERSRKMSFPGFATSNFSILHLLVGERYQTLEDIQFNFCEVEYTDFNDWLNISGFSSPVYTDNYEKVIIEYKRPGSICVGIADGWKLEFEFRFSGPSEWAVINSVASLEQDVVVKIIPDRIKSYVDFLEMHDHFLKFLALNYLGWPPVKRISFFRVNDVKNGNKSNIQYIKGIKNNEARSYKEHRNKQDFLFRYDDFGKEFPQYINAWYSIRLNLNASIDMLGEALMERGLAVEFYFTGMVQALENIHRKTHGAEVALRQRIEMLKSSLSPLLLRALLHNEVDFEERIVMNRNHYTHFHSRRESFVPATIPELFLLAEKLKIMTIALLLQQIGLSSDQVARQLLAKSVWLYNHLMKVSEVKDEIPDFESLL